MTLKRRLLLVFLPLSISPFVLLMLVQLLLSRSYLLNHQQELMLLEREVVTQDFVRRQQQLQQSQLANVTFFRNQLIERAAQRFQGHAPLERGLIVFTAQGEWLYPTALNGRTGFSTEEASELNSLLRSQDISRQAGWFIRMPSQIYSITGLVQTDTGLSLLLYQQQAQALAPLYQSAYYAVLIGILTLSLALSLMVWASKRISNPISHLTQIVTQFGAGNSHVRAEVRMGGEVGVLAQEFNQMADRLQSFTKLLESKISERTQELEQRLIELKDTQEQLIQAEKLAALGSMVAGIAHELNTPIGNAVTVASSLIDSKERFDVLLQQGLTRSALDRLLADVEEGSQIIHRNLQRTAELIKSFKQLAIDQTSDHRRNFSLSEVGQEVLFSLKPSLKQHPWQLSTDIDAQLEFDSYPGALSQILINLINNAVLHAFTGRDQGQICITGKKLNTGWASISIKDNGLGIPEDIQQRVFEPFFTCKLGQGGSGLGLHICYNLATNLLGGRILLHSKIGTGSEFILELPLVAPQAVYEHQH